MTHYRITALASGVAAACVASALWNPQYHTVTLGDEEVRYRLAGAGTPAVILEAGLGLGLNSFDPVFDAIAAETCVFAYDRPGYGHSSPTSRPRSFDQVNDDLHLLLQRIGVPAPYILAGHSLGGQYMLNFAQRYPTEVAAVVLIDTPHPDLYRRLRELNHDALLSEKQYWDLPENMRREYGAAMRASLAGNLGSIPLIVITSGAVQHGEFGPLADATQQEIVRLSTHGKRVVAESSGHMVMRDDPDLVVRCIFDALTKTH